MNNAAGEGDMSDSFFDSISVKVGVFIGIKCFDSVLNFAYKCRFWFFIQLVKVTIST